MNNRKGYAVVEAAMIFPLVIFSVMAVFFMMISMYTVTAETSSFHAALLYEAGRTNDTYTVSPKSSKEVNCKKSGISENCTLTDELVIERENFVFLGHYSRKIKGKARSVDEETIIRVRDFALKEAGNE